MTVQQNFTMVHLLIFINSSLKKNSLHKKGCVKPLNVAGFFLALRSENSVEVDARSDDSKIRQKLSQRAKLTGAYVIIMIGDVIIMIGGRQYALVM